MDFQPVAEHRLLRDTVRSFFENELPPERVRELDEGRRIPRALWRRLGELGWMGLAVPEEHGGGGADVATAAVLTEELARHFPSLAGDYVLASLVSRLLVEHGSEEQRAAVLPGLATGESLVAIALTEPHGGTDLLALRTAASLGEGGWTVRGQKLYTTLGEEADQILVLARTDEPEAGHPARGLSLLLVPRQAAIETRRLRLMAMRASGVCEVFLDDAVAPRAALVGERGRGFHQLVATLDEERVLGAAIGLGIAGAALEAALRYARERVAFGRPIGAFQSLQHYLADTAIEVEGARQLVARAAWLHGAGQDCALESAMAKVAASEAAVRATDRGMRILAAHGLLEESPMQLFFRDARMQVFSPVSNEMARNIVGERLGLPRSY